MAKKAFIMGLIVSLAACGMVAAETVDTNRLIEKSGRVKVYISGVTNNSGQAEITADGFRKVLESSINNRRSIKFEIVPDAAASDFRIAAVIKKYAYSKTDPINSVAGPSALLLDAVTTENYAEMSVDFTVTSTKTGKAVWKENVSDYVEHTMTPEESIPLVYDKTARRFLWKAFGKGK